MFLSGLLILAQSHREVAGTRESAIKLQLGEITAEIRHDPAPCHPGDRRVIDVSYQNLGKEGSWVGASRTCSCAGGASTMGAQWLPAGGRLDRSLVVIADPRVPRVEIDIAIRNGSGRIVRSERTLPMEVLTPYTASFTRMETARGDDKKTALVVDIAATNAPLSGVYVPFHSNLIRESSILEQCEEAVSIAYWMPSIAVDAMMSESSALLRMFTPIRGGAALVSVAPLQDHDLLVAAEPGIGITRWSIPFDPPCGSCELQEIGYFAPVSLEVRIKSDRNGKPVISVLRNARTIEPLQVWLLPSATCSAEQHERGLLKTLLLPAGAAGL